MQESAAGALWDLAYKARDALIATGVVPLLIALLRSDKPDVQQRAAGSLRNLANGGSQQNKEAIIAAGALPLLIALSRSDQPVVQQHAAGALKSLANGS